MTNLCFFVIIQLNLLKGEWYSMKFEDVILMKDEENATVWNRINLSNPSELINISMGVDEESVSRNIDEFVIKFTPDKFVGEKSFSGVLSEDSFSKKDIIINSFRKYRFIIFDNFKENFQRCKEENREYFTIGAIVDDVSTQKLNFRICILIDYIYKIDNYAVTALFGFDGIYLTRVTKELVDLYDSSLFPCLKLWELIISGNEDIDSFLEERKFLSEKIPYSYSKEGEISSYSISIEELYDLMDKKEQ